MTSKSYSSILARPSSLFVGIDLGTSGCRAIAINAAGEIKAHSQLHYLKQNLSAHKPADWWHATLVVLKDIITQTELQHIEAISIDGTSGTVLLCDDNGNPLTQAQTDTKAEILPEHQANLRLRWVGLVFQGLELTPGQQ